MKKKHADKISVISCSLLVIAPAITLLTNEPPPTIAVGQYIIAGGGALGLVAMAISKAWEKKRNESE
ncbi:hypothetical protein [Halobacillus salinus]|uniref:hypothetical protein n=1 Tax=Halobacillus salinus TaxID=192814 RepID=UPI0009A614F4|nr:hypothetical protein [Halobacillus salinus]